MISRISGPEPSEDFEPDEIYVPPRYRNHHGKERPFVSWDGEGVGGGSGSPQNYVLLMNSAGGKLVTYERYLESQGIFEFLLSESDRIGSAIHVGYGFNYDVNMFLRNVPFRVLRRLYRESTARWRGFRIEWYPGKWFSLSDGYRNIQIQDTISHFHVSLVKALESDPQLRNDGRLATIRAGKTDRGTFEYSELDGKVVPYTKLELELHCQLMTNYRETLKQALIPCNGAETNLVPRMWYGPSAIISTLYGKANIKRVMSRPQSDLSRPRRRKRGSVQKPPNGYSYTLPDEVNRAAIASFAGGRFEAFKVGHHDGPVYGYDINSAYPDAMRNLPPFTGGHWSHYEKSEIDIFRKRDRKPPGFGFYRIYYDDESNRRYPYGSRIYPLFRRSEHNTISFPPMVIGWYPYYSTRELWRDPKAAITQAFVWHQLEDTYEYPFSSTDFLDFGRMFEIRNDYDAQGRPDLKYAVKITLNSGYGKLAQQAGAKFGDNLPAFHQMEWASHITDHCRSKISRAGRSAGNSLVAIETDAIYSTEKVKYCEDNIGSGLGQFKRTEYTGILYLQSGIYFTRDADSGKWEFHYRGLDKGSITYEDAYYYLGTIDYLSSPWPPISGTLSTFTGMGGAGIANDNSFLFYSKWLQWPSMPRDISPGWPHLKRVHVSSSCQACIERKPPSYQLHDLIVPRYHTGKSHASSIPWLAPESENAEFLEYDNPGDRWSSNAQTE